MEPRSVIPGVSGPLALPSTFAAVLAYAEAAKEKNSDGNTPLHRAAANKAPAEVVELLLAAYPEAAKEKNSDGNTPLLLAVVYKGARRRPVRPWGL